MRTLAFYMVTNFNFLSSHSRPTRVTENVRCRPTGSNSVLTLTVVLAGHSFWWFFFDCKAWFGPARTVTNDLTSDRDLVRVLPMFAPNATLTPMWSTKNASWIFLSSHSGAIKNGSRQKTMKIRVEHHRHSQKLINIHLSSTDSEEF